MSYISQGSTVTASELELIEQIANLGAVGTVLTVAADGVSVEWTAAGSGANAALDNLSAVAINAALTPGTTNTIALGSLSKNWSDAFFGDGAVIDFNNDVQITHSANTLTIAGGNLALGANSLTLTGSIGATGARVTKGWFTDLESTNAIVANITGTAAIATTVTAANEATDAASFIAFVTAATGDLGIKTNANMTFNSNTGVATFASAVLTTADINGGTLDGVAIGGASPSTAVITTLSITSFGANWTNAGRTVADLGIVTTVDINGGTLDGVIIGGASAAAGTFTTISGTTITASTGFALGDGDYIGVTGNEILTFATAGTITLSGADFIVADGNGVVVGNSAQIVAGGITPEFQIIGTSTTNVDSTLLIANYSTTATSAAVLMFAKSDQGTPGSFALLDSGDTVGGLSWVADDGVDLTSELARIFVYVDGSSGSNDMPGRIVFSTASDSAAVVTDRWIIDSSGALKPASDGAFDLGTTALAINNIHLDTGATINFENGNAVITHSSGIITVSTGEFRVTTPGTNSASVVIRSTAATRTIVLSGAGGWPSTTSGAASNSKTEYGTNDVDMYSLDFDQSADEFAQWTIVMPDSYDGGTITAIFYWTAASGTGTVAWNLQGRSYANDEAIDQAWGTEQEVSDTLIATGDVHVTSATAAITLGGTPAGGELVQFRVFRDVSDDTLDADAKLLMVKIEYGINNYTD